LPYLQANSQMPMPYQPKKKKHVSLHRHFDLNLNYVSIPRYSALEDKNLVYFFDKAKNKRLLEELREEEVRKKKRSEPKTHRVGGTSRNRQVSQTDFLEYI
jgi:hypothetical protein